MMHTLEATRDALALCASIVAAQAEDPPHGSCAIGMEANIGPADYPLIRIVPVRVTPGKPYANTTIEAQIILGAQIALSEGLESVYSELFDLSAEIITVIKARGGRFIELITDEDQRDTYKLMAIRCELLAPPHHESGGGLSAQAAGVAGEAVMS